MSVSFYYQSFASNHKADLYTNKNFVHIITLELFYTKTKINGTPVEASTGTINNMIPFYKLFILLLHVAYNFLDIYF